MANLVAQITLGIDVSKDHLAIYHWENQQPFSLPNHPAKIKAWLKSLTGPVRITVEPTSTYHLDLVQQAHAFGHTVYLVNPRQLSHYREALHKRHKTDPDDAWLLARFLDHEVQHLTPYQPQHPKAQQLWTLLKRRATLVESQKQLKQSLANINLPLSALLKQFKLLLQHIDQRMHQLLDQLNWTHAYRQCLSIPGIGPLNAIALVTAFNRGAFAHSDAFIAFIGLDVRIRDSGTFKGKRKLTKRGESEIRRLLFCATQPARSYLPFDHYYHKQINKGLSKTAAKVILARKLARIAFSIIQNQQSFKKSLPAC